MMSKTSSTDSTIGCGVMLFNLCLGGWLFDYCLWNIAGKDVPWYADMVAGMFTGQFALPVTVIVWILKLCGVHAPFFGGPQ